MFFEGYVRYVKYMLFSRHSRGHGIHSPFVFDLVSRVFRNKIDPGIVLLIENIRKKNLSDKTSIRVLDLGAGSIISKSRQRKVCDIAKYSSVPPKYGILLSNLAAEFGKPGIIEFGTSLGISTMYLAAGRPDADVFTMEGCPALSSAASDNFKTGEFENIILLRGAFDDLIPRLIERDLCPGLVFIDGNHRKDPLLRYFSQMADISSYNTVIVIDDIHLSAEMEKAWLEIKKYDNVSCTIDLFRMGLVFFRKGLNHYDYVIRY